MTMREDPGGGTRPPGVGTQQGLSESKAATAWAACTDCCPG